METGLNVICHGEPLPPQDEPVYCFLQLIGPESKASCIRVARVMGDLVRHTMAAATWQIPPAMPWLNLKLLLTSPVVASMIQHCPGGAQI